MQHKKQESIDMLLDAIDKLNDEFGRSPTNDELCKETGLGTGTVSRYLNHMSNLGLIEYEPRHKITVVHDEETFRKNIRMECVSLNLLGSIPCGNPDMNEEYVEAVIPIPTVLLGNGEHYLLRTHGLSMINAGIEPDDIVLIRKSDTARINDIVVALTEDNESTLKRLAWDNERECYFLQPENDDFEPIYKGFSIQGVVEKIIKDPN
ncbi:MAG: S24 family peptidase [Oscillospiraceae bacterium]|nr:S24 family peptidase [Oscillospiraceae bacterium]